MLCLKTMAKGLVDRLRPVVTCDHGCATTGLGTNSWMLAFQLIELGLLISNRNYAALLQAGIAFVTGASPDRKQIRPE
jgi:hypothetical protein